MKEDIHKKTQDLLKKLDYFIIHVLLFMLFNAILVHVAFSHGQNRWWVLLFVGLWAVALIYHGLKVYGVDLLDHRNKKINHLWSWVLKLTGP